MRKRSSWLLALSLCACVFPAAEPTGVEFSWRFFEGNQVDGEAGVRVRSCAGAGVDTVAFEITDDDTPTRQGIFRFPCADGYQTLADFQTDASDAFLELHPGLYGARVFALDPDALYADAEWVDERALDVAKRQVTTEPWEIVRAPVAWLVALAGAADCDELSMALYYDDVPGQLPEYVPAEGEADAPVLYREQLVSLDGALRFDGTAIACAEGLDITHIVPDVDRGAYLLEITIDGSACTLRVEIDAEGTALPLDLAHLPCGG